MSNPFEWLDTYEIEKIFSEEGYSDFSDYYSEYAKNYDLQSWYEYLLNLSPIEINERSLVLDLGCGTGDMLIHFMNDGAFVVGVDYSSYMLDAAEDNIIITFDDAHRYILMKKDISEFYLSAKFDFIYSMGDTVNYLSPQKLEKLFSNVKYMLKKGSVFTFDAINPAHFEKDHVSKEEVEIDETTKISFRRIMSQNDDGLFLDTHFDILDENDEILSSQDHHQRVYTFDEIYSLACKHGYTCEQVPFLDSEDNAEKIQVVMKVD